MRVTVARKGSNRRRIDSPPLEVEKEECILGKMREDIDKGFEAIMEDLKEKKKISAAAQMALRGLKERYGQVITSLFKLVERRTTEGNEVREDRDKMMTMVIEGVEKCDESPKQGGAKKSKKMKGKKVVEGKAVKTINTGEVRKEVAMVNSVMGEKDMGENKGVIEGPKEDGFTKVESKKNRNKNSASKKLDAVKARKPESVFILAADKEGEGGSKKRLWSDLIKQAGSPKLRSYTTPRGEIILKPADVGTLNALRSIQGNVSTSGRVRQCGPRSWSTMWTSTWRQRTYPVSLSTRTLTWGWIGRL